MISRKRMEALVDRELAEQEAQAAQPTADKSASTPYQNLVRAAQSGQFEGLVAEARPAEPVAMVTPQEREAELRASGHWPAESESKPAPKPAPPPEPAPEPPADEMPDHMPGSRYPPAECVYSFWRPRGSFDERDYQPARGGLISQYDPFAEFDED
jgi:hypothetical protein